ncbi:MAG: LamG domain-containing protein, partial [Thiohalobacterales bacterium]|nr:LamG domain-containing protein [Thiohalobacterales bacterium]
MVVVNPTTLVPADAYKKALFESWGYTVSVISESANQSTYDAAAVSSDVVYVSSTVNSNTLGSKLANLSIGVVSEDGDYNDDLGFASGSGWPIGNSITVTDTSHYITAPFAAGQLDIYAGGMEQLTVSGTEGPGLQTLADAGEAGALVVLDTGATGSGGTPVAGPRVMLPVGRAANVNWDHLNANGRLLVQRALQWGTGNTGGPQPNLLLVVVDPASLTAEEAAKKALIESWGYAVNLIDDSDSQANFDAAIAANDVAYVSSTVSSITLGTKLVSAPIGVVNELVTLVGEFGIGQEAYNYKSRIEINVLDNSHYITQPFATGLLTIFTANQNLHLLTSNKAPDFVALAQVFNTGTLWDDSLGTIEAGGALYGGGTAAGRRVLLPWGDAAFDVNALNADGQTLMQRAIDWAAGTGAPNTQPIAHWTFDESSGPTAFDSVGGNDATLYGDASWTTGTINGAVDFDGSGDSVRTDNNFTPPPVGTVTFWMRVSGSPASHQRILGLDDTWEIRHVTTGTADGIPYGLVFDLGVTGVNTEFVTTTTIDAPGKWYHIAASYDTTSDAYAVYVDGVLQKSGTYPSALTVPAANLLSMGTRTGSSNYYDGMLDDVRIYDQFLSAEEIAELASGGSTPQQILLVVADATSLTAQETARKTLIEGWGYGVKVISASDSQANFDGAVAGANAAYVVEQQQSTVLGTKLRDASIAVINEEVELRADIGFSANRDWPTTRTTVDITDNSHYITSPFATGLLTIATAPIEVVTLSGQMAGGLQPLAQQDWGGPQNSL